MRRFVYRLSLILIFLIPWEGVIEFHGLGSSAKVMGLVVAAFWILTVIATGQVRRPTAFLGAAALFVGWAALSVFWSADPINSLRHVSTWIQVFGLAYILWDIFRTREALMAGLQAFVLGVYVAIGGALINYFSSNPYYHWYQRYTPGAQTSPDGFGFIIALGLPVACYLAASPTTTTRLGRFLRALNLIYIPVGFLGIVLSGTRTAAIASVVGLAFGLAILTRLRLSARIAVLLILAVSFYLLLPVVQPLRSFQRFGTTETELTQGTWNGRLLNWEQGLTAFTEHPIIGVGTDQYRSVDILGKLAHNSFLSVLVELGLIGFALFAVMLGIVVNHALAHPKWEARFWITLLLVWTIDASSLTYEYRKATWFVLSFVVVSAAVHSRTDRTEAIPARTSGLLPVT